MFSKLDFNFYNCEFVYVFTIYINIFNENNTKDHRSISGTVLCEKGYLNFFKIYIFYNTNISHKFNSVRL